MPVWVRFIDYLRLRADAHMDLCKPASDESTELLLQCCHTKAVLKPDYGACGRLLRCLSVLHQYRRMRPCGE